ncbi:hypothetical protein BH11VER1_BH11VER1_18710 [soil metagenome]
MRLVRNIPSTFQRNTLWTTITAVCFAVLAYLLVKLIFFITDIISFLQPLLIPFAIAGVLAYLLEPVVARLVRWGVKRQRAVLLVFSLFTALLVGISFIIIPAFVQQSALLYQRFPDYAKAVSGSMTKYANDWNSRLHKDFGIDFLRWNLHPNGNTTTPDAPPAPSPVLEPIIPLALPQIKAPTTLEDLTLFPSVSNAAKRKLNEADEANVNFTLQDLLSGDFIKNAIPVLGAKLWRFITSSLGGFLGVFGFLLSMIIVPLYLYYFLTEGPKITQSWSNYLPLRASKFKDEVVGTLTEINRYLIAFFRGQLVVSLINGIATGIGLEIVRLDFGWLIGLSLCVLGIMPYLGIALCWIPAVIIASVQQSSYLIGADSPWWVFPLVVTAIFAVVQQIDGLFITPKIVGESVGLHPMTVIFSVFAWSLVMGGLLGAILAVPMTAALKVLFQRYIWQRAVQQRGLQEAT